MSLLIVNTLPRGDATAQIAVKELAAAVPDHRVIQAFEMKISPCVGCNACWLKTPGICAVKDDYEEILKAYLQYDAAVFLAGTALDFVDHRMKNVIDRMLPLATMYTCFVDGQMRHVARYDRRYRFGLLYSGKADGEYLNDWMKRVALNMNGISLGAYPAEKCREVLSCIL